MKILFAASLLSPTASTSFAAGRDPRHVPEHKGVLAVVRDRRGCIAIDCSINNGTFRANKKAAQIVGCNPATLAAILPGA